MTEIKDTDEEKDAKLIYNLKYYPGESHHETRLSSRLSSLRQRVKELEEQLFSVCGLLSTNECKKYISTIEKKLASAQTEIKNLKDVLHIDRSGLASAIEKIQKIAASYSWVAEGRGSYSYDDAEYQKEAGRMVDEITSFCEKVLTESGNIAHAECCGRGVKINWKEKAISAQAAVEACKLFIRHAKGYNVDGTRRENMDEDNACAINWNKVIKIAKKAIQQSTKEAGK
jgi:ABC-type transporter Mla MlaB component